MNQLVILATFISSVYSTSSCPDNCLVTTPDGTTYDLSALKGIEISQTIVNSGLSSTYSFNLCGQDTQTCPEDKSTPPVISGMAVQKQDEGCFVLGVYNEQEQSSACSWSNTAGYPLSLTMISGSSEFCQGSPRGLEIGFTCADTLIPKTWTASNPGEGCNYIYNIPTCAVCKGGCPSSGGGFSSVFLILVLGVALPTYLIGGMAYQYHAQDKRGIETLTALWPTIFMGYVGAGLAFTIGGCKGIDNGNTGSSQSGGDSSDTYQPYQNI